jgi:hypothetical protein
MRMSGECAWNGLPSLMGSSCLPYEAAALTKVGLERTVLKLQLWRAVLIRQAAPASRKREHTQTSTGRNGVSAKESVFTKGEVLTFLLSGLRYPYSTATVLYRCLGESGPGAHVITCPRVRIPPLSLEPRTVALSLPARGP